MPFKSEAQRKKMYSLEAEGKLPKGTAERWEKHTGDKKLPERLHDKKAEFYLKVARDLGLLHAMKQASIVDSLSDFVLRQGLPIIAPAAVGAAIAGPDRRVEGAVAGAGAGVLARSGLSRKMAPMMGMGSDARAALEMNKGSLSAALKAAKKVNNTGIVKDIEGAHERAKWVARGLGGAAGGLGVKYFMSPTASHPSLAGMPEANYDAGSHYYSGVLPEEEQYSYGLW